MSILIDRIRATLWSSAFLFAAFWIYIIVGGIGFRLLEHDYREDHVDEVNDQLETDRATLLNVLWAQTIATSEEDWMEVANERLDLYEKKLKAHLLEGIDLQDDAATAGGDQDNPWTLLGSIFYCYTVVTTIGYGNLAPATATGKILTILYGTCGIPLTLILLGELGKFLALAVKLIYCYRDSSYDDEDNDEDEAIFTLTVALSLTGAFMLSGSLLFSYVEGWTFLDAAYFCFVTFSTIGFGDMVPEHQGYALLTVLYSLTSLSLMAMCMTVIQSQMDERITEYRERVEDWWDKKQQERADAKAKKAATEAEDDSEPPKWKPQVSQIKEEPTNSTTTYSDIKYRGTRHVDEEEEEVESEEIEDDD